MTAPATMPEQPAYSHSIKIEDTAKGIRLSVHVYANSTGEAKTYSNDKYTFEYPNGCKIEKKENRFTSIDASIEC